MNDLGLIDTFLDAFIMVLSSGFGMIVGDVSFVFQFVIFISIVLMGLFWALGNDQIMASFVRKVLLIGFFTYLLNDWERLSSTLGKSFALLGLKAGGNLIDFSGFLRPGALANTGLHMAMVLIEHTRSLCGPTAFFINFPDITVYTLSFVTVILSFFGIAILMFLSVLHFKIVSLFTFILLPFSLFNKTTFLAERALGQVVSSGLRLGAILLVVSVTNVLVGTFSLTLQPTLNQSASLLLGSLTLWAAAWYLPNAVARLVHNGPSLSDDGPASVRVAGWGGGGHRGGVGGGSSGGGGGGSVRETSLETVRAAASIPPQRPLGGGDGAVNRLFGGPQV